MTVLRQTAIIAANAVPRRGGQGMNLSQMVEGLDQTFDLSVYAAGMFDTVPTTLVPPSRAAMFLARTRGLRKLQSTFTWLNDRHFDAFVARKLSEIRQTITLFQGASGQCLDSLRIARTKGAKTVVDAVNPHIDLFVARQREEGAFFGMRPITHPRMHRRIRQEYEAADLIRVMSGPSKQSFLERGFAPDRVAVATPPVDYQVGPPTKSDRVFRVGYTGLLEPRKGFRYLIEAFNLLDRENSELVIWGAPGARAVDRFITQAMNRNPKIHLKADEVTRHSIAEIGYERVYGDCSVVVLPSLAEGFGYVVTEAMASGVPVIVTDEVGAADVVVNGENGFIIPPRDATTLAQRLAQLADNPKTASQMGAAARATVSRLSVTAFRDQYVTRLRELLAC